MSKKIFILLLGVMMSLPSLAQITGVITDAETGETLPYVRVSYPARKIVKGSTLDGKYSIQRIDGAELTFGMIGYETKTVRITSHTPSVMPIQLKALSTELGAAVVKGDGIKYKRKNNPAVELMERIIKANKKNNLRSNNYYEFYRYQKMTFARNNVKQDYIDSLKACGSKEWMTDQVERCDLNGKLILPMQTNEMVTRTIYRKSDDDERNIILGDNKKGVMSQMSTLGDQFNAAVKECFVDVDIYQNQIILLQQGFTSPIGKDAIGFYHFYINDTTYVGDDQCYDIYFAPNNHQDVGFSGHLYALTDSTLHIRRVELKLPKGTGVNFVEDMSLNQEFVKLDDGQWVLDADDMLAELTINKMMKNMVIIRRTKYSNYAFTDIPKAQFHGKAATTTVPEASFRTKDFWDKFRTVELTESEKKVDKFAKSMLNRKGWKWLYLGVKTYADDFIRTSYRDSVPSKFDFGPLTTLVGKNKYDGWRARVSGRTKTALSNHFFWRGYVAYGFESRNVYYSSEFTYSLNKKIRQPWEFPIRQLQFTSAYDIMSPSDKFLTTNKDNWLTMIPLYPKDEASRFSRYLYNRQKLSFQYETAGGLCITAEAKCEGIKGVGAMEFFKNVKADMPEVDQFGRATNRTDDDGNLITENRYTHIGEMQKDLAQFGEYKIKEVRTTEFSLTLRYAPGETYLNTNLKRYPLTQNAPIFIFSHSTGFKGFLGSNYATNYTEISFQKRVWLKSWGKMDFYAAAKSQWNKVPMPLLIMPATNQSWVTMHDNHTFELMRNMEFLNDRVAHWQWMWDLNGKIFNRIPLIKKLKWREVIVFRGMFGHLTKKNDPSLDCNEGTLMAFPDQVTQRMGRMPYMEISGGIHNIFKLFEIDYVYRLTYREAIPDGKHFKNGFRWGGIRVGLNFAF